MPKNSDKLNKPRTEIVAVEAKPVEIKKEVIPKRVENIRIDKIGSLTLNIFAKPLKARYEKHYRKDKLRLVFDLILVAIIIILLAVVFNIWFFSRTKLLNLVDFKVSSNPENLINGQNSEFIIDYTNTTKDTMTAVTLVLKRPASLHNPEYNISDFDSKTNTLKIGELAPNAHGQFTIKGFLLGNLDTNHEFLAVINYKNKFGQDRQEFFRQDFFLNGSALQADLTLPAKAIATSPFIAKLQIKNTSEIAFNKLKIKMQWPKNYKLLDTDLSSNPTDNTWTIGDFEIGQEGAYTFTGKAYIENPQNIDLGSEIFVVYDSQQFLLAKVNISLPIEFAKFKIQLTNLDNNQAISPGGQTTYTLFYKNEEAYSVSNVELGLNLEGAYVKNQHLSINQNKSPQLAEIAAGQEGTIEINAEAKSLIDFTGPQDSGFQIEARAYATYDDPVEKNRISVESQVVSTKVNSRLSINTAALFYTSSGDQIGVGSVPPIVDEYTSYWVIVKITNTNNKIKDVKISGQIPVGIEYTDIYNVSHGNQVVFNPDNRTITWTISEINQFAGIFNPGPEARIQLALVPTNAQINTSPLLLTNISATATDATTGAFLSASGKNVSIAIFPDPTLNKVTQ